MKIHLMSDIHLETGPKWQFAEDLPDFDVAVYAGNIHQSLGRTVRTLASASHLQGKPVILVPGNREHHGCILQDNLAEGLAAAEGTNVRVLARAATLVGDVRFVGATLWTDYALQGAQDLSMRIAAVRIADHRLTRYREPDGRVRWFTPLHALDEHMADREFVCRSLRDAHPGPTVVVTHHAPSKRSLPKLFRKSALWAAFASDLESTIRRHSPALWLHGNANRSLDYRIGATRVACNPKGYGPTDSLPCENPLFDCRRVIAT